MPGIKPGTTNERSAPNTQRHGRIYSGHPRLACCYIVKTWMPGIKPGMTDERLGTRHAEAWHDN
jgi:hypothetical protein